MGSFHSTPTSLSPDGPALLGRSSPRIPLPQHIISDICSYLAEDSSGCGALLAVQQTSVAGWLAASPYLYETVHFRSACDIEAFLRLFGRGDKLNDSLDESRTTRAETVRPMVKTLIFDHWNPDAMSGLVDALKLTLGSEADARVFPNATSLRLSRAALAGITPNTTSAAMPRDMSLMQSTLKSICLNVTNLEHLCVDDAPSLRLPHSETATFLDIIQPSLQYLGRLSRKSSLKALTVHHANGLTASSFAAAGHATRLHFPALTSGVEEALCSVQAVKKIAWAIAACLALWKRPLKWEFVVPNTANNRTDVARFERTWAASVVGQVRSAIRIAAWTAAEKDPGDKLAHILLGLVEEVEAVGLVSLRVEDQAGRCAVCGDDADAAVWNN